MYEPSTQPSFEHMDNTTYMKENEKTQLSPLRPTQSSPSRPTQSSPSRPTQNEGQLLYDIKRLGEPHKQNNSPYIPIKNKPVKKKKKKRNASRENSVKKDDKKEWVTKNNDEFALLRGPRRLQPLSNYPNRDTLKNILRKANDEFILPTKIGSSKGSFVNSGFDLEISLNVKKNSKTKRVSNSSIDEPKMDDLKIENNRKTSKSLDISSLKTKNTDRNASESPYKNDRSKSRSSLDSRESFNTNSSISIKICTQCPKKTKTQKSPRRRSSAQSLNSLRTQSPYHQSVDLTKRNSTRKRSTDSNSSRQISRTRTSSVINPLECSIQAEKIDENPENASLKCSQKSLRVLVNPAVDSEKFREIENKGTKKHLRAKTSAHRGEEMPLESPISNETFLDNDTDADPFHIEQIDESSSSSTKRHISSSTSRSNTFNDDDSFDNDDVSITDAPLSTFFLKYSEKPVEVVCRYCRITVTSQIEKESKSTIYLTSCLIFCFAGILNCCFTPCCVPSFRNVRHKCPICYTVLGSFKSPMKTMLNDRLLTNIISIELNRPSIDSKSDLINRKLEEATQ